MSPALGSAQQPNSLQLGVTYNSSLPSNTIGEAFNDIEKQENSASRCGSSSSKMKKQNLVELIQSMISFFHWDMALYSFRYWKEQLSRPKRFTFNSSNSYVRTQANAYERVKRQRNTAVGFNPLYSNTARCATHFGTSISLVIYVRMVRQ